MLSLFMMNLAVVKGKCGSEQSSQQPVFPQWTNHIYPEYLPNVCEKMCSESPTTSANNPKNASASLSSNDVEGNE